MAPVGLSLLTPPPSIYSLQFNVTVTNLGPNPVAPGAVDFYSMLRKPDLSNPGYFLVIPTFGFVSTNVIPPANDTNLMFYQGAWYQNMQFTNSAENLLGVGWLEVYGRTNLYVTQQQDLITYSSAAGNGFSKPSVILGGYAFTIPADATTNDVYQIQIGRPSATTFNGISSGTSVSIAAPTDTNFAGPGSINALKNVTIGQLKYIVGSVYPSGWYNAGDFGSPIFSMLTFWKCSIWPYIRLNNHRRLPIYLMRWICVGI